MLRAHGPAPGDGDRPARCRWRPGGPAAARGKGDGSQCHRRRGRSPRLRTAPFGGEGPGRLALASSAGTPLLGKVEACPLILATQNPRSRRLSVRLGEGESGLHTTPRRTALRTALRPGQAGAGPRGLCLGASGKMGGLDSHGTPEGATPLSCKDCQTHTWPETAACPCAEDPGSALPRPSHRSAALLVPGLAPPCLVPRSPASPEQGPPGAWSMPAAALGLPAPTNTATTPLGKAPAPRQLFTCWRGCPFLQTSCHRQPAQEAAKAPPPSSPGGSCQRPALTSFRRGLTGITRYESL